MNKALKVLNEELHMVKCSLNSYKGQVETYRQALEETEEMVALYEKSRDELMHAIALITADEN